VWANWTLGIGGADSTSRTEESAAMTGSRDSSKCRDSAFPEHRIRRSRAGTPAPACRRAGLLSVMHCVMQRLKCPPRPCA